jgi:Lrp/AsnC family transcriptional regulator, leucine-responsive regulatory protein
MATDSAALDRIDREILAVLRDEARIGWSELGARVRLSPNAAADRVRRLVRTGVVRRFTADIDQSKLGRTLDAVIDVRVDDAERFRDGALTCDEVTWLAHVTGRTDFQLHVSCAGTAGLNALLTRFRDEFGASETLTTVVLEHIR